MTALSNSHSKKCLVAALAILGVACSNGEPEGAPAGQADSIEPGAWFTEISSEARLHFSHEAAADEQLRLPAVTGGGAALFDADNDGDLDIYLTNGDQVLAAEATAGRGANRLYRRESDGRYVDVTGPSGLGDTGYGMGVATGDVDNDGDVDVYVTNYGPDALYLNRGDGTFVDVSASSGAAVGEWSASAAFCDFDRDGLLDLYVTRYVDFEPAKRCSGKAGELEFCGPKSFHPVHDVLLRNEGIGADGSIRFADVSEAAGISETFAAGLGIVCFDANGDGWQDAYVANDAYPNQLWINQSAETPGEIRLGDDSLLLGVAYNLHGQAQAGMGVIAEDLNGSGSFDIFLTHLTNEANTLYSSDGDMAGFRDVSGHSGLGPTSMPYTGFGVVAFDAELDGDLDLFIANGKVNVSRPVAGSDLPPPWNTLPEPNLFYLNDGEGRFQTSDAMAGASMPRPGISRAAVGGDIDGDGDIDLLVANLLGQARLYRNDAPRSGNWLAVRAHDPELNRDALGARVAILVGDQRFERQVSTASSYLTSHSPVLHFGLGEADRVSRIEVTWPNGTVESFPGVEAGQAITLRRGEGVPAGG